MPRPRFERLARGFQQPHFDFHRSCVALGRKIGAGRTDLPDDLLFSLLEAIDKAGDLWFAHHFEEFTAQGREGVRRTFCDLYRRILLPVPDSMEVSL